MSVERYTVEDQPQDQGASNDAVELRALRLRKLIQLMSDISEDCWCAGWINGNEFALYRMAFQDGPRRYGMGEVREDDVAELRRLAIVTDSWVHWKDDDGEMEIPLADFRALLPTPDSHSQDHP